MLVGRVEAAKELLSNEIETRENESPDFLIGNAYVAFKQKNFEKALNFLDSAESKFKNSGAVYFNIGLVHHKQGQITLAKQYYSKAKNFPETALVAGRNLALLAEQSGDFNLAFHTLNEMTNLVKYFPAQFEKFGHFWMRWAPMFQTKKKILEAKVARGDFSNSPEAGQRYPATVEERGSSNE